MLSHASLAFVSTAISFGLTAQSLTWVQVATTGPNPREQHGMAYDAARQRAVLFGGQLQGGIGGDTWEWNGAAWAQLVVSGPSARRGVPLAYDSLRQRTVLFGGWDGSFRADTWEWTGTAWIPQVLAIGPGPRERHAMAFDSVRGRVVLFGGFTSAGSATWLADTWEWDGTTWHPAAGGPPARAEHAMAFDSQRGRTVMFGGAFNVGGLSGFLGDTWEWDGVSWVQRASSGPAPRSTHAMVYDSQRAQVLLTGGHSTVSPLGGLWAWNGTNWTSLTATSGVGREGPAMVYDSHRGRTVLFGGIPWIADTWELVSTLAGGTPFGAGCGTPPLALAAVPSAPPSIGTTAQATLSNAPSPVAFVALGVSNTTFGPFSLPVTLASVGMPGCSLLQSTEVVGEPSTPTGATTANYSLAIPNNVALIGFHVYLQGWAWAPGANAANVIVSNGLDWQIGA